MNQSLAVLAGAVAGLGAFVAVTVGADVLLLVLFVATTLANLSKGLWSR